MATTEVAYTIETDANDDECLYLNAVTKNGLIDLDYPQPNDTTDTYVQRFITRYNHTNATTITLSNVALETVASEDIPHAQLPNTSICDCIAKVT